MKSLSILSLTTTLFLFSCTGVSEKQDTSKVVPEDGKAYDLALSDKLDAFSPISQDLSTSDRPKSEAKIKLGHMLYFDTRLSKDGTISCNSCHNLATFGVDNLPNSPGDAGEHGDRNSPTVLNAALHTSQFWDGRAADVEEQAGMPVLNPIEMAIPNEAFLINRLKEDEQYVKMFADAYPDTDDAMTYENLRVAIAAFERQLGTPSRFDDYLKGDNTALTTKEKKGLLSFINVGCITCHAGPAMGGNQIQKFGVHKDYWTLTGSENIDEGRFKVTGEETDKYQFKVPSLRNIEHTGPYLHDGSVEDLEKVIRIMAEAQLDYNISDREVANIKAFLGSLTGEVPAEYQVAPAI